MTRSEAGRAGAEALARQMSKRERTERARKAAISRWAVSSVAERLALGQRLVVARAKARRRRKKAA